MAGTFRKKFRENSGNTPCPVGKKKHLDVTTTQMFSLNCLAITLTAGVILEEGKRPSLVGERNGSGGILGDNLGEGTRESKNCLETVGRQLGILSVSRVLFRKRELTQFCNKLGEFCGKLGEFALAHK